LRHHLQVSIEEAAQRLRGIALISLAMLMFSLLDASAKYASQYLPTLEVVWARYTFSMLLAILVLRSWSRPADYLTNRPFMQALRALFLLGSTALNFVAIRYLQLAETAAITFAAPLLVTALAGPILGEWPGIRRWAAVIVGFVGVLIIVQPEPGAFQPAALFSIAAAFCYAGYSLTTRSLSATETPAGMLIYGSLLAVVVLTPALPAVGEMPPNWIVAAALVATGVFATIGHWCLILANRHAPAPVLAPFQYTQILYMPALGYLIFADIPGWSTLIGAAVVTASGLYIFYRERVHRDR
jgi:drug/metabolite transporter (DMT)-like permease